MSFEHGGGWYGGLEVWKFGGLQCRVCSLQFELEFEFLVWELGVWSWEFGVGSLELGVWSWEFGVGSLELGVWSWEFEVRRFGVLEFWSLWSFWSFGVLEFLEFMEFM